MNPPKRFSTILFLAISALALPLASSYGQSALRNVKSARTLAFEESADSIARADSLAAARAEALRVRDVDEIMKSLPESDLRTTPVNKVFGPWVFLGYRNLARKGMDISLPASLANTSVICGDSVPVENTGIEGIIATDELAERNDSSLIIRESAFESETPTVASIA
ncbi:MAG: hypothetical protein K2K64_07215, partial [Muribaculaceae bacterium]|nr:hypothetical protein [Muribaculaceae bacterium]